MKKFFVILAFGIFAIFMSSAVFAQEHPEAENVTAENILGENAGTLPDSPFYGLKRFGEDIRLFFTFDKLEKTKLEYNLAQLRLAEAKAMIELNKLNLAERALKDYEEALNEIKSNKKILSAAGKNTSDFDDLVGNNTYRHIITLERVYEKVPDAAKSAIRSIIKRSLEEYGNITEMPKLKEIIEIRKDKAEEQISNAKELIMETEQGLNDENATNMAAVKILMEEAKKHLSKAEIAFNMSKYGEAFGQAISAEMLARNAERFVEGKIETEKSKIRAEIIGNSSEIDVNIKFLSTNTENDTIAQEILGRIKMNRGNISDMLIIGNDKEGELKEELDSEASVRDNSSKVEVTYKFPLNMTNETDIIEGIYQKLSSLTVNDVLNSLELKIEEKKDKERNKMCLQVITYATKEGECKQFSNSCIPEGWKRVSACPTDNSDIYKCEKNEDCITVKNTCCDSGCSNKVAINKNSEDYWNKKKIGECEGKVCPAVIFACSKPKCIEGKCKLAENITANNAE